MRTRAAKAHRRWRPRDRQDNAGRLSPSLRHRPRGAWRAIALHSPGRTPPGRLRSPVRAGSWLRSFVLAGATAGRLSNPGSSDGPTSGGTGSWLVPNTPWHSWGRRRLLPGTGCRLSHIRTSAPGPTRAQTFSGLQPSTRWGKKLSLTSLRCRDRPRTCPGRRVGTNHAQAEEDAAGIRMKYACFYGLTLLKRTNAGQLARCSNRENLPFGFVWAEPQLAWPRLQLGFR